MIKKHWKKILIGLAILILIGAVTWVRLKSKNSSELQVQTQIVERGNIVAAVSASGTVVTGNMTDVTTQASGVVSAIYVTDGTWVNKGDKIAQIDLDLNGQQAQSQAYASYLSAKNSLESAKITKLSLESTMWQAHETFESRALDPDLAEVDPVYIQTDRDWRAAEQKYLQQDAVIAQSQTAFNSAWLSYLDSQSLITAPVAGTINSLAIAEGLQLNSALTSSGTRTSQRVAAIYSEGQPLASFNISEVDINSIKVGQKATLIADALSDKTFTGEVVSVDRVGTTTSGVTNYAVIVRLDTAAVDLLPNMAISANIIINQKSNVVSIPASAIQSQNGSDVVTVMRDGRQEQVIVELGLSSDTQTEVVSGLNEGEEIVVSSTANYSGQGDSGASPFSSFGGGGQRMMMVR